jgi:hypothetical protein
MQFPDDALLRSGGVQVGRMRGSIYCDGFIAGGSLITSLTTFAPSANFNWVDLWVTGSAQTLSRVTCEGANTYALRRLSSAISASPTVSVQKGRGTIASPVVNVTLDELGSFSWACLLTTGSLTFTTAALLRGELIEPAPGPGLAGTRLRARSCAIGSATTTDLFAFDQTSGFMLGGVATTNIVVDFNRVYRNRLFTVATLPAGVQGMRTMVTDALAPAFGAAVAGGGAVTIPVYYTGAAWFVG